MQNPSTPATGYPYPGPPAGAANGYPPPPPGTTYSYSYYPYNAPPPPSRRAVLLRRLILIIIAICIIFGTIFLILVLVLRPSLPTFYLNSLTLSNFNSSNNSLTGKWDVQFQVTNPNKKMSLSYDDVTFSIFYDSDFLAQTRIPPFDQGTKEQTLLNSSLSVVNTYVDRKVADSVNKEKARGSVGFDVKLMSWLGYRYGGWRGRRRVLVVWCEDAVVGVSSSTGSGKLVGGAKRCRVR